MNKSHRVASFHLQRAKSRRTSPTSLVAGCGWLAVASCAAHGAGDPATTSPQTKPLISGAHLANLPIGRVQQIPLSAEDADYKIIEGQDAVQITKSQGKLLVTALKPGQVVIAINALQRAPQNYVMRVVNAVVPPPAAPAGGAPVAPATAPPATNGTTPGTPANPPGTVNGGGGTGITGTGTAGGTTGGTTAGGAGTVGTGATTETTTPDTTGAGTGTGTTGTGAVGAGAAGGVGATTGIGQSTGIGAAPTVTTPGVTNVAPLPSIVGGGRSTVPSTMAPVEPSVSPALPAPSRGVGRGGAYPTRSYLPTNLDRAGTRGSNRITVTQGLAVFINSKSNILAVFFSDPAIMDARAINARTLAVTGLTPGTSTLAVFVAQGPDDVVGRPLIYHVVVESPSAHAAPLAPADAGAVESALRAALNDPRIAVSVIQLPNGELAARLTGAVHDVAEITAAKQTASLFVPENAVISSVYASPTAPTLEQLLSPTTPTVVPTAEELLENKLRQITGNESVQLVPLPNGMVLKAEVSSTDEASDLVRLLPSIMQPNQKVIPFIRVRGASGTTGTDIASIPIMTPEDEQMSHQLQDVTGVRNVYVIRTAVNGVAVYGTVRNRTEYDQVRRFASVIPVNERSAPAPASTNSVGNQRTPTRANAPSSGSQFPLQVQMFVRVLDPAGASVRRVTIATNVVEISRAALRNLGVEVGSVGLLSESITAGTSTVVPNSNPPIILTNPDTITRTIDPTFRGGAFTGGTGFLGLQSFRNIDPVRARLNALYQNGNARVLSQPNLTALEGNEAQITIGGQRPIPTAAIAAGSAGGATAQSVEFRKFGIILTMRPTVTDDETIILQVRADVTALDSTTSINLGGAIIPGETARSVDTTITLREGDTIVMGGLITNDRRVNTSQIPILSSLPIIGSLFKSKRFENNESELAIFLSPQITRIPASMETQEAVLRSPGLPELPGNEQRNDIFNFGGAPGTSGQAR